MEATELLLSLLMNVLVYTMSPHQPDRYTAIRQRPILVANRIDCCGDKGGPANTINDVVSTRRVRVANFYLNWLVAKIKPIVPPLLMNPISRTMYRFRCWKYRADLNKLAILYGTDKNGSHFYTQHYQRYFSEWRLRPLRVLEIGVGGYEDTNEGAWSLRMWKRFFPNAQIVGIDLYDKSHFSEDRITVLQADQTDAKRLAEISEKYGPFDIIVDDGSHLNEHVINTFRILFPLLKNPGFYAAEDLQTAYWPSWGGIKGRSSMDYLKSLTDGINHAEHPDRAIEEFDTQILEVAFFHNLCILRKGDNNEQSNAPILSRQNLLSA